MQCAAMSAPQARSSPRGRATTGFVPIESVEAASRRPSPSGWRPAKWPKPAAPVDSTAARSRSTTESAVASETPAAAYVRACSVKASSLCGGHDEVGELVGPDLLDVPRLGREVAGRVAPRHPVPGDRPPERDLPVDLE